MTVAETPPIIDGHNDTLLHLYLPERGGSRTFFTRSDLGHIDLPRARDGGFAGGFFAVFVPSDPAAPLGNEADVMRTATGYAANNWKCPTALGQSSVPEANPIYM